MNSRQIRRPTRKQIRTTTIAVIVLAAIIAAVYIWGQPFIALFSDQEKMRHSIESFGIFGPLIYMLLQATQVLIAPIPGQITGLASGYLFGPYLGLLYSMVGAAVGFTIIFLLTRKFGRPLVERFFDKKHIEKFDYIIQTNGVMTLFLIFLLPAFPDDMICFLAGLTKIPIRTLIFISIAGRLPGYYLLALTGSDLANGGVSPGILTAIVVALFFVVLGYANRVWLDEFVKSDNRIAFIKRRWTLSKFATTVWLAGCVFGAVAVYVVAANIKL